jgi:two-component system CheB/CheR fusion protein
MRLDSAPKRKVLVVDDNADAATALAALLTRLGHEVETAHDGPVAVAAARRFRPDVVFLDIALPGMDGFRVAEELRSDPGFARTLIVAVTGLAGHDERVQGHHSGIDVYLIKPVDSSFIQSFVGDARDR